MKSGKLFILRINQKKLLKNYTIKNLSQYKFKMWRLYSLYSQNSKTTKSHISILKLTDKFDLRIGGKNIALSNLSIYYTVHFNNEWIKYW